MFIIYCAHFIFSTKPILNSWKKLFIYYLLSVYYLFITVCKVLIIIIKYVMWRDITNIDL